MPGKAGQGRYAPDAAADVAQNVKRTIPRP